MEIRRHLYSRVPLDSSGVVNRREIGANWTHHCVASPGLHGTFKPMDTHPGAESREISLLFRYRYAVHDNVDIFSPPCKCELYRYVVYDNIGIFSLPCSSKLYR